jgi:hypothetical protein
MGIRRNKHKESISGCWCAESKDYDMHRMGNKIKEN